MPGQRRAGKLVSIHKTQGFEWQTAHTKGCQEDRCCLSAIHSSTPLFKVVLLLYLTFKSMPKRSWSNHRRSRSSFAWARTRAWPSLCTIDFSRKRTQTCKNWVFLPTAQSTQTDTAREVRVWMTTQIGVLPTPALSSYHLSITGILTQKEQSRLPG